MVEIAVIVLMVVLSAVFSSTETAFTSLNQVAAQKRGEKEPVWQKIHKILQDPQRFLSTVLVGNNIANIVTASLTTAFVIHTWGEAAVPWSTIALTVVLLLFAEIIPKSIAAVIPQTLAVLFLPVVQIFELALWPLIWGFIGLARILFKILRIPAHRPVWVPSVAEIKHLLDRSEEGGSLDSDRGTMIDAMLELADVPARSMMVPRPAVIRVGMDMADEAVALILQKAGFTRVPVYRDNPDNVVGILLVKDFLQWMLGTQKSGRWQSLVRKMVFFS